MSSISKYINFILNRCPSCGFSATTICARCWFVLNEIGHDQSPAGKGLLTAATKPFVQRALFRWDDRREPQATVLREVILSSKESPSGAMMRLWAHEFVRRGMLSAAPGLKQNWIVLSPPGRSGYGEDDHAGALAREFSEIITENRYFEGHVFERVGPAFRGSARQKTKSKKDREKIEFRIAPLAKRRIERASGFIFVDDVIATGATARAAWTALGKPRAFECWAIAWRTKAFQNFEKSSTRIEQSEVSMLD